MYQTDRFWEPVCKALGREDLLDREDFRTHADRIANGSRAVEEIQRTVSSKTVDEWTPLFDELELPWSPIFDTQQVVSDEQALVNQYIIEKPHRSGAVIRTIAPPFRLRGMPEVLQPAPEVGQYTEEILLELGFSWDEISTSG
jgi:crotonobetainyl-CoA:carnitine CoA-transferase CaiB-like acyl-CoA transferase